MTKPQESGNGNQPQQSAGWTGDGGAKESNLSSEEIAARAYDIYEREGRQDGKDMDHWLQAEAELRAEKSRSSEGQGRGLSGEVRPGSAAASEQAQPRSARQL